MTPRALRLLLAAGEGLTVEFKEKWTAKADRDLVAFANGKGGRLLLGVSDAGKVVGCALTNALKAEIVGVARNCNPAIEVGIRSIGNVVVVEVAEGEEKPYACAAGYYRRLDAVTQHLTQKEIVALYRAHPANSFDARPNRDCRLADISLAKVNAFLETAGMDVTVNRANLAEFLTSVKLLERGRVRNAGVLFFANDPGRFFLHSQIFCLAFKGTERDLPFDRIEIRDDLRAQFRGAVFFLEKHLNRMMKIVGTDRLDYYEIPMEALREAITNALMHRDYTVTGTSIMVEVYSDRVEIVNPGGLPPGLKPADFGRISIRRNELIADLFHRLRKAERMGVGIGRMRQMMRAAKLPDPLFSWNGFFTSAFRRPALDGSLDRQKPGRSQVETGVDRGVEKGVEKLTPRDRKILSLIALSPRISKRELKQRTGFGKKTVENTVEKLKEIGLLERIGPERGGFWKATIPERLIPDGQKRARKRHGKGPDKRHRKGPDQGREKGLKTGRNSDRELERKLLAIIARMPILGRTVISRQLGITPKQARRLLVQMKKNGIVRRSGPVRGGHWEIVK